jgi:ABC-type lipoprotein release transport system permease subunit
LESLTTRQPADADDVSRAVIAERLLRQREGVAARLRRLVLIEALLLGSVAAVAGCLLGSLATWYLVVVGIDLQSFIPETLEFGGVVFDPVLRATWDLPWMGKIALYVVGLTLLAALYPAVKAGRVTPAEAMRHH